MKDVILAELKKIEERENVKIIMAIESGSRAWGFASPDSDYDVRFIYIRKPEDYLKLEGIRDVIEWQLDDVLDINGWDLKKALQLLHKSNPTVFEWCASPIVYYQTEEFEELKKILPEFFSIKKSLFHYWHMAETHYREYLKEEEVRLKKYFYALRPLLAAKWIIDKQAAPPMLFDELVSAELEPVLLPEVERLLEMKKNLPEMEKGPKVQVLNEYIERALPEIKSIAEAKEDTSGSWDLLNTLFLSMVYASPEYMENSRSCLTKNNTQEQYPFMHAESSENNNHFDECYMKEVYGSPDMMQGVSKIICEKDKILANETPMGCVYASPMSISNSTETSKINIFSKMFKRKNKNGKNNI